MKSVAASMPQDVAIILAEQSFSPEPTSEKLAQLRQAGADYFSSAENGFPNAKEFEFPETPQYLLEERAVRRAAGVEYFNQHPDSAELWASTEFIFPETPQYLVDELAARRAADAEYFDQPETSEQATPLGAAALSSSDVGALSTSEYMASLAARRFYL